MSKKEAAPVIEEKSVEGELLEKYVAFLDQGKYFYGAADQVFAELLPILRSKRIHRLSVFSGEEFELVDNFKGKNVAFKPCGVKRFELKAVKGTKRPA